jgi:hypothetical protein
MIIEGGEVKSAYFYRKSCTFIREGCEALCCFASINCFETDAFIHGYKVALWKICEKFGFRFSVIEETADNHLIIDALKRRNKPALINPTAYFFYNFVYHTFHPNRCFIIN